MPQSLADGQTSPGKAHFSQHIQRLYSLEVKKSGLFLEIFANHAYVIFYANLPIKMRDLKPGTCSEENDRYSAFFILERTQ